MNEYKNGKELNMDDLEKVTGGVNPDFLNSRLFSGEAQPPATDIPGNTGNTQQNNPPVATSRPLIIKA